MVCCTSCSERRPTTSLVAANATTPPRSIIQIGDDYDAALEILARNDAKDISNNIGMLRGSSYYKTKWKWYVLKDNTCINVYFVGELGGPMKIQEIQVGERSKGYGSKLFWLDGKRLDVERLDLNRQ